MARAAVPGGTSDPARAAGADPPRQLGPAGEPAVARAAGIGDAALDDGRRESLNQRLDRNWAELLQELRVTQTGTQILTGFLLAIAFQPRFEALSDFQERIYLVLVGIAVLTTALGLAPVSLHRSLFRRRAKLSVVRLGHVILRLVLLGVGLVLTGTVLLIFDVVLGRGPALAAAGAIALVMTLIALLPTLLRLGRDSEPARGDPPRGRGVGRG